MFYQIDDYCRRLVYKMYRRFIYAKMAYAITRHFDYASSAAPDTCRHRGHVLPCHLSGRLPRRRVGTSIRTLANEPEQPPLLRCLGCLLRAESPAPHGLPARAVRCDDGYQWYPDHPELPRCKCGRCTGRRHVHPVYIGTTATQRLHRAVDTCVHRINTLPPSRPVHEQTTVRGCCIIRTSMVPDSQRTVGVRGCSLGPYLMHQPTLETPLRGHS